jgi:hypothetical protein
MGEVGCSPESHPEEFLGGPEKDDRAGFLRRASREFTHLFPEDRNFPDSPCWGKERKAQLCCLRKNPVAKSNAPVEGNGRIGYKELSAHTHDRGNT